MICIKKVTFQDICSVNPLWVKLSPQYCNCQPALWEGFGVIPQTCSIYRKSLEQLLRKGNKAQRCNSVVSDIAALSKTSKINQASARTNQPQIIKEGESSSVPFVHKTWTVTPCAVILNLRCFEWITYKSRAWTLKVMGRNPKMCQMHADSEQSAPSVLIKVQVQHNYGKTLALLCKDNYTSIRVKQTDDGTHHTG